MQTLEDVAAFASECCAALGDTCYPPRVTWSTRAYRWLGTARQSLAGKDVGEIILAKRVWGLLTEADKQQLVAHEVCHLVCVRRLRFRGQSHGRAWSRLMEELGYRPDKYARIDISSIELKRRNRYPVHCSCRTHAVSPSGFMATLRDHGPRCKICGVRCVPGRLASPLDSATRTLDNIQA